MKLIEDMRREADKMDNRAALYAMAMERDLAESCRIAGNKLRIAMNALTIAHTAEAENEGYGIWQ